ncbi:MAG: hypothetical protein GY755_17835, partial [Chloroflexi bacterium]|nr:hypothetical protein [Chloroflexota bacterium]
MAKIKNEPDFPVVGPVLDHVFARLFRREGHNFSWSRDFSMIRVVPGMGNTQESESEGLKSKSVDGDA